MITHTDEEWQRLQRQLADLTAQLVAAQARIAELEARKLPPPPFVKATLPERVKKRRAKRAVEQNHARQREAPTQVILHPIERCPTCRGSLSGLHVKRRRQILELPATPPLEILEHQVQQGWCSYCHTWREAQLDLRGQVVGQSRVGVRLMALVAYLRQTMRLPLRAIQQLLATVHQVQLSVGELSDLLRRTAQQAHPDAGADSGQSGRACG